MIITNRRRQFGGEKEPKLQYPDAFMAIFNANAGTRLTIHRSDNVITKYILDDVVHYVPLGTNRITIPTSGTHTLYYYGNTSSSMLDTVPFNYLRIPANTAIHNSYVYNWNCVNLKLVDFLGVPPNFYASNIFWNGANYTRRIRIPVGTLSTFQSRFANNNNCKAALIETNDFTIIDI